MYRIGYSRQVDKFLQIINKRNRKLYDRFQNVFDDLERNPYQGEKLGGEFKGAYKIRVGQYRIVYEIHKNQLLILIIDIGHRRDIYRVLF